MPGLFVRRLVASLAPLLLLAGCSSKDAPPAAPEPTASQAATQVGPSAEQIVDDPRSRLLSVGEAAGGVRATVWKSCPDDTCQTMAAAVALSGDGFASRVVADRVWHANPLVFPSDTGSALVVVWDDRMTMTLIHPDGSLVDVRQDGPRGPVLPGEIVGGVDHTRRGTSFFATDPVTGIAHEILVPAGSAQVSQLPDGQLRVTTLRRTYAWSDDGGATWHEQAGASDGTLTQSFVASTPDTHVLVGGSDGATLFPFSQIRRLEGDGDWSVVVPVDDPMAYVGPTAVLPDGRFVASIQYWSDNGLASEQPKGTPPGIHVSVGDHWSTYERVESGAPFRRPRPFQPMVTDIDVTAEGTLVTAIGPDQTTAWTSGDLGATWREMRVR